MPKPLGRIASPPDPRDRSIRSLLSVEALAVVLPRRYRVRSALAIGRFDQQENSCVGQSLAFTKIVQERRDMHRTYSIDPLWIWDRSKEEDGIGQPEQDRGTYIRTAIEVVRQRGAALARTADPQLRFRVASYYACSSIDEVKAALYAFGCVVLGQSWPKSWFNTPGHGRVPKPDAIAGGHATAAYGYDDDLIFDWLPGERGGVWAANSWDESFGRAGDYAIPYSLFGPDKIVDEAWQVIDDRDIT